MTLKQVVKEYLVEMFDFNEWDRRFLTQTPTKIGQGVISVFHKCVPIFRWSVQSGHLQILSPDIFRSDVVEAVDRTGLYPLEIEFVTSGSSVKESLGGNIRTIELDDDRNVQDFGTWFNGLCSSLGDEIYLIPDTNFLRRCYFNNFLTRVLSSTKFRSALTIIIPRLCILEIEDKYNRSSGVSKQDNNNRDIEKVLVQYSSGKERRVGLSSIKEVISIKKNGGRTNPSISDSLLYSFSRGAGKKLADHWIRKEVKEFTSTVSDKVTRNIQGETIMKKARAIFLTCDIMNSLAAVSENIDTLYILRREPSELRVKSGLAFANLVYNTAIQFGECTCRITYLDHEQTFNVLGMWKGKTTYDWLTDKVRIDDDVSLTPTSEGNRHGDNAMKK